MATVGSEFQRTEDALRGVRGLFASSDRATRSEFPESVLGGGATFVVSLPAASPIAATA
jgi:hypothetical protein